MAERKDHEQTVTDTWGEYQRGLDYQGKINLAATIQECERFMDGKQWPDPKPATIALPRPVVNIVKFIARNKAAAMNNSPVRLVYEADTADSDSKSFTEFADYMSKEMAMNRHDAAAVNDGVVSGTYIHHFYWDKEAVGRKGEIQGAVRCEEIDPLDIFFANPIQVDEQRQKYIIIRSRVEVDSVKTMADKGVDLDRIVSDEADQKGDDYDKEQDGTKLVTLLTKYFRKDGEVFCEKSTKGVVVNKAFSLRPDVAKASKELYGEEDAADAETAESPKKKPDYAGRKFNLYPISVGQYEPRKHCIFGRGEVEGIIPCQRTINEVLAMTALQIRKNAWSKWIVRKDALKGQQITNEPGQVIVDHSAAGKGIEQVPGAQISALPMNFVDAIMSVLRTVTGSTEVMTGETSGANMSGAAIAQLQSQASMPIEELRNGFWRFKEKDGKILEQFYRHYYNVDTNYRIKPEDDSNGGQYLQKVFNAELYDDAEFTVVVKAQSGTRSSPAGDIAFLDGLLASGAITAQDYVENYPDQALSDKSRFVKVVENAAENALLECQKMLKQREEELVQAADLLEQQNKVVNNAAKTINENKELRGDLATLYREYLTVIGQANKVAADNDKLYKDATAFAHVIAEQQNKVKDDDIAS